MKYKYVFRAFSKRTILLSINTIRRLLYHKQVLIRDVELFTSLQFSSLTILPVTWSPFWPTAVRLSPPPCRPTADHWRAAWPARRPMRWVRTKRSLRPQDVDLLFTQSVWGRKSPLPTGRKKWALIPETRNKFMCDTFVIIYWTLV